MNPKLPRRRWLCHRLFALSILLTISAVASAAPAWLRLRSADFTIYTDSSKRELEEFAVTYAAFRQVCQKTLLKPGERPPPSTILLFRNEKTFTQHVGSPKDRFLTAAAFSMTVDDASLTALAAGSDIDDALSMLFEFETTWMLARLRYFLPTWMGQGAGEVFSSLTVTKSRAILGERPDRFEYDTTIPWPRFFEIDQSSPEYRGKKLAGSYHAQAWFLMNWVLLGGDNPRDRFQSAVAGLRNQSPGAAIQTVFGCPIDDLSRELYKHSSGPRHTIEFPFDPAALRSGWSIEPAPVMEIEIHRAEILAAAGKTVEARTLLQDLATTSSGEILAQEALARAALRDNDEDAATRHYRRAIELGSKNPRTRLHSASASLDESRMNGSDYAGNAGNNAAEAIAEIDAVLALDPDNLEAYRLLGRAPFVAPRITEADLEKLTPGIGPGQAGSRVRFYRALLFQRLQLFDKADEDLRLIIDDPDVLPIDRQNARARLSTKAK